MCFVVSLKDLHLVKIKTFSWLLLWYSKSLVLVLFTSLKCPNFSSSHLDYFPPKNDGKYFPSKTVENIFHQKRWKIFSGGKCFPQSRWILSKSKNHFLKLWLLYGWGQYGVLKVMSIKIGCQIAHKKGGQNYNKTFALWW